MTNASIPEGMASSRWIITGGTMSQLFVYAGAEARSHRRRIGGGDIEKANQIKEC